MRIINLLLNQLMPYVTDEIETAGLPIAAYFTPRPDLEAKVPSQLAMNGREFRAEATQNWNHPNFYRGLSAILAVTLQASQTPTQNLRLK